MTLDHLARKYDGQIPKAELDRAMGRLPAAVKSARSAVKFYRNELNRAKEDVAVARRNLAKFEAHLAATERQEDINNFLKILGPTE